MKNLDPNAQNSQQPVSQRTGFPPLINNHTRVLIVGTFPGQESLRRLEYYGHPRNQMWRLLYDILGETTPPDNYQEKTEFLLENRFGMWDILDSCVREGSLDQSINDEEPNDFASLLAEYTNIHSLLFNGQKAWYWFNKYQKKKIQRDICCYQLPSTSPAYTLEYGIKRLQWKQQIMKSFEDI